MAAPAPYQYGLIRSQHNGYFLDVESASRNPDTGVCCWERNAHDNQLWYFDTNNSVIRTKLNDFVLEYSEGKKYFVINPFKPENPNQRWRFEGGYIKNAMNPNLAFSLPGQSREKGTKIISSQFTGQPDQVWSFESFGGQAPMPPQGQGYNPYECGQPGGIACHYTAPTPNMPPQYQPQQPFVPQPQPPTQPANLGTFAATGCGQMPLPDMNFEKREFVIKSEMDDKVLDVKGEDAKEGALLVMYKPHRKKNQLWYLDTQGCIRSSLNGFVFYAKDKGSSLHMVPYVDDAKHKWRLDGHKIVNGEGSCLDIRGGKCHDGSELCAYDYKSKSNQHWRTEPY